MRDDLQNMLRRIFLFDIIIGIIASIVLFFISSHLVLFFMLGLLIAFLSLVLNGVITKASLSTVGSMNKLYLVLGFFSRVLLVCLVGIVVYHYSDINMIVYIVGYSIQFISLVLYGVTNKE